MPQSEQNFANHTKWDPKFHFFLVPLFAAHFIFRVYDLYSEGVSVDAIWDAVTAFGLVVLVFTVRIYALRVQDRLIRLEERLRLQSLLPETMQSRIGELRVSQLIALRFASDREAPGLVEQVLKTGLDSKEIKKAIQEWRADHFRV